MIIGRLLLLTATLFAPIAHSQPGEPPCTSITLSPKTPRQGTIFRVSCNGATTEPEGRVHGRRVNERLHFVREGSAWVSLAPVPVDATDSLFVEIEARTSGDAPMIVHVPTARGAFPTERLTVAPRFGQEPDSATRARMDEEARRSREVARGAHETPKLWTKAFAAPRASRITSTFGRGREFNGTVTSRHLGTDFAGKMGDPVRASNRGIVRLTDRFFLGGNVIYIDHGAGITTAYLHLSKTLVAVGDTVAAGQVIGRVGATGRVTGPHLHLIARYGEVTVDPMSLIASARAVAAPKKRAPARRR